MTSLIPRLAFLTSCLLVAIAPLASPHRSAQDDGDFPGWPAAWQGRPLQPVVLSPREERFTRDFPGKVGRFHDGRHELILRWIARPSRKVHPAMHCFRAAGYAIDHQPPRKDADGAEWGYFLAEKDGTRLRVSERIIDNRGQGWSDIPAWYWSAVTRRSQGPWWAVTKLAVE